MRITGALLLALALLASCLSATPGTAGIITIDKIIYDVKANKYDIAISGGNASQMITIFRDLPQGKAVRVTPAMAMTDAGGAYSQNGIDGGKSGYFRIIISMSGGGVDTFKGIVRADNGKKVESQEQRDAKRKGDGMGRLNGLPFDFAGSVFVLANDGIYDQFELVNLSGDTPYALTSLRLYQGLDPAFFTPGTFDSPSAIASGTLANDLTGDPLGVAPSSGDSDPTLTFVLGPIDPTRYDLLVGTAAPIFSDGSLGDGVPFSFAHLLPVPEPASLPLLLTGFVAAIGYWRSRQMRAANG